MGVLDGRVAIITGAGRGIGEQHALLFAREGAAVVVNDFGGANDGTGGDAGPAHEVAERIRAEGGRAVANTGSVASWDDARTMVEQAVAEFGRLDVVVNNAGILRDGFVASLGEEDVDAVLGVHLKGHLGLLHHAAAYWKQQHKAGEAVDAAVINTSSPSGTFMPNAGQSVYGAAKAGIAALTLVAAEELARYGVRVNAIAPIARTRLTLATPGMGVLFAAPVEDGVFDALDPSQIAPLVAYLASPRCRINGRVYSVQGGAISELVNWGTARLVETEKPWTTEDIAEALEGWN